MAGTQVKSKSKTAAASLTTSKTFVPLPIVHAIKKVDEMLGPDRKWQPINKGQKLFLERLFGPGKEDVLKLSEPELKSLISKVVEELNTFLRENGYNIQLEPFDTTRNEFGVVSILNVLVKWIQKGEIAQITTDDNREFKGVRLKDRLIICRSGGHPNPIACISTKSKDSVFMTIADKPFEGFGLVALVEKLNGDLSLDKGYSGVEFPMVDLDQEVDISWLRGMGTVDTKNEPWFISQAKQQTKFRMNEIGARAESAVAVAVKRGVCMERRKPLVINKPFFIWIMRPGLRKPLFVGYIAEDVWNDPGREL